MSRPTKKLRKSQRIAFFVQELIRDRPLPYAEVRDKVGKEFSLSKTEAGGWLGALNGRYFIIYPRQNYSNSCKVITIPTHIEDARKMFERLRAQVPVKFLIKQTRARMKNASMVEKIIKDSPNIDVLEISSRTGLCKNTVKDIIGQLYAERRI